MGLKDHEVVRKVVYLRNCPPLLAAAPVEVNFKEQLDTPWGVDQEPEVEEFTEDEIQVTVVIDASLDFNMPVTLRKGSTILTVKEALTAADPTGRTRTDSFWLRLAGSEQPAFPDSKRLCQCCSLEVTLEPPPTTPPPRAAPATATRSRRGRQAEEQPSQVHKYFVAGSWCDFKPTEMTREGSCFVHMLKVGPHGYETFQILLDGSWDAVYYPSVRDANPDKDHKLRGPDKKGHGVNWMIGALQRGRQQARPGSHFKIVVSVDGKQLATRVTWRQVPG